MQDSFPPYCPEAERGVLGCCLLDTAKTAVALKAGANTRWFFDARHAELFNVLSVMAASGGGDWLKATLLLREQGKLEGIGGIPYLNELQNGVPSAENIDYYIPELQKYFRRRQLLSALARLTQLTEDPANDPASLIGDTQNFLEGVMRQAGADALPEIISLEALLASDIPIPPEIVSSIFHQGSKIIMGGSSKSYKTWLLSDLALAVSTGTPWLGFPTIKGKVLYVNLEIQTPFFRRRMIDLTAPTHLERNAQLDIWNLRGHNADYRWMLPKMCERIRDQAHVLVIIDPTYKLLGAADENSASDVAALLNMVDTLALETGAAVALAGHFAKGNASAKETIDRISGSGVFARDPDSLIIFTKHEEEGAFTVDMVLRNLPPVNPFVVRWQFPRFLREDNLDPAKLKQVGGRPPQHKPEHLLECLGGQRLKSMEWQRLAKEEFGVSNGRFFELLKELENDGKVQKSVIDSKWEQIRPSSGNYLPE